MSDYKAKMYPTGGAYSAALDQDQSNKLLLQTYTGTIVLLVLCVKKLVRENDSFYLEKSGKGQGNEFCKVVGTMWTYPS